MENKDNRDDAAKIRVFVREVLGRSDHYWIYYYLWPNGCLENVISPDNKTVDAYGYDAYDQWEFDWHSPAPRFKTVDDCITFLLSPKGENCTELTGMERVKSLDLLAAAPADIKYQPEVD